MTANNTTHQPGRPLIQTLRAMVPEALPYRRYWQTDLILAALFVLASLILSFPALDLHISSAFYHGGSKATAWPIGHHLPWSALYYVPPVLVGIVVAACLIYLALSYMGIMRPHYRIHCVFILMALWVGSALVAEGILKMNVGRPRPCAIVQFGGWRPFVQAMSHGVRGTGKSFPCGHTAALFSLSAFYFLCRRQGRWTLAALLPAIVITGVLVGVSRVAAGGHFASDVAWSLSITFLINIILYYVVFNIPAYEDGWRKRSVVRHSRPLFVTVVMLAIIAIQLIVYIVAPIHKNIHYESAHMNQVHPRGIVRLETAHCTITLCFTQSGPLRIEGDALGYGLPGARFSISTDHTPTNGRQRVALTCLPRGPFYSIKSSLTVTIPMDGVERLELDTAACDIRMADSSLAPDGITSISTTEGISNIQRH